MTPAIEAINVSKVYRRYARKKQFATLKSALLKGSLIRDLQPDETFPALRGVSFTVPKGCTYGIIGRNGSGKSTLLKCVAGITRPNEGTHHGRRPHLGADRARRRISSRRSPAARTSSSTASCSVCRSARSSGASTRSSSSPSSRISSTRRSRPIRRGCTCGWVSPSRFTSIPTCCSSTKCSPSAIRRSRSSASTSSRSSAAATRPSCS